MKLTFPKPVADLVREHYGKAKVILEYGSGGSTVLAARLGKIVFSVETDPDFLMETRRHIKSIGLEHAQVFFHHAHIGPVKKWGYATDLTRIGDFRQYPSSVWSLPEFQHPDLVLIDGRFRLLTFLTVLIYARHPITILFDDYENRPFYQQAEKWLRKTKSVGRMAVFHARPATCEWLQAVKTGQDALALFSNPNPL